MTIYSQHPNRGKVQILATYRTSNGVASTTVTSVESAKKADPIVDALNRISACATVPVSVWDQRDDNHRRYPREHLHPLTNPELRPALLTGAHSLWYELVMLLLHEALNDLDDATADTPSPVRQAIVAEVEKEARELKASLDQYHDGTEPEAPVERLWGSHQPFVAFEGGMDALSSDTRERMDMLEDGAEEAQLRQAVGDMRVLYDAYQRTANAEAMLDIAQMSILDDRQAHGEDYYLSVDAPRPGGRFPGNGWNVHIGKWIPDEDDPDSSSGDVLVGCDLPTQPAADDLVRLLDLSATDDDQLAAWAITAVGQPLAGTTFLVTHRYDED